MINEILDFHIIRNEKEGLTKRKGKIRIKFKKRLRFKDTSVENWHSFEHHGKTYSIYIEMDSFGYYINIHNKWTWTSLKPSFCFRNFNHAKDYCSYMCEFGLTNKFKSYDFVELEPEPKVILPTTRKHQDVAPTVDIIPVKSES